MRYYLVQDNGQNLVFDIVQVTYVSNQILEFKVNLIDEGEIVKNSQFYLRKISNKYFCSFDQLSWKRIAQPFNYINWVYHNLNFTCYRGYRPSGLSEASEGALMTKMPGKVIKILAKIGQKVQKGQTLAILEAMKMENEIKSHIDGTIKSIYIEPGQTLEQGHLLMELES